MFKINVLTFAILFEKKILMFSLFILLLNLFIKSVKVINWVNVRCCEILIAIFWKANLNETCLKIAM